jgi:hypothetical protein
MSKKLCILSLLLATGLGHPTAQPVAKMATINRVGSIATQLLEIANRRAAKGGDSDRMALYKETEHLLRSERDPDALARVALISNIYLHPGNAGDESFDEVFDVAWGACVRRIEQIGGQSAIDALEFLESNMRLDGAYSLTWKESMERLKAKQSGGAGTHP